MRYPDNDTRVRDALAVVRKYDPATYQRMDNDASWVLTSELSVLPEPVQNDLLGSTAFGTTYPVGSINPDIAVTFLNCDYVEEWADDYSVDRDYFAAAILVHEFRHTHQRTLDATVAEPPAFAAGSAFAAKLPNPSGARIKNLSDETVRQFQR
jgi:hypothetical protein